VIQLYFVFLIIGIVVFLSTRRLSLVIRIVISFAVFLVLSLMATFWVEKVGDKPLPGAVTVYPEKAVNSPK
jgi:hypothetical protein